MLQPASAVTADEYRDKVPLPLMVSAPGIVKVWGLPELSNNSEYGAEPSYVLPPPLFGAVARVQSDAVLQWPVPPFQVLVMSLE